MKEGDFLLNNERNDLQRQIRRERIRRRNKRETKIMTWSLLVVLGYFLVMLGIAVFNFIG